LRDAPDWTFSDGSPAPECKAVVRAIGKREKFFKRVQRLAALADLAAKSNAMPKLPGIKRHRKRDVAYYFDNLIGKEENILDQMEKKHKIIQ
jgi:hypothetical protein